MVTSNTYLLNGSWYPIGHSIRGIDIINKVNSEDESSLNELAIAVKINGELTDPTKIIPNGSKIEVITRDQQAALELIRHDASHVLAGAIKELYPEARIAEKNNSEEGFYCDFYSYKALNISDLIQIEERMLKIIDRDERIEHKILSRNQAISYFIGVDEFYKADILSSSPDGQIVILYKRDNFLDLCGKFHLASTGVLGKAIKLIDLSDLESFWKEDKNYKLKRVYGKVWQKDEQLRHYLDQLEKTKSRDHRKLGHAMALFHFQHEAPGFVFWHPRGWVLYRTLQNYIRNCLEKSGYVEVNTPIMLRRDLWEESGHWDKFRSHMFITDDQGSENRMVLAIKPMSCPCHVQIFNQSIKSYHDLPLRLAEFGYCHRKEPSGSLYGLMRVRAMVQDDAHIFCMESQVEDEVKAFYNLLRVVYKKLGFDAFKTRFSSCPRIEVGESGELQNRAEELLRQAVRSSGVECSDSPGEGAFYGPKLEFILEDSIGRNWQCGTLQVDCVLPKRLGVTYIGKDGKQNYPVILHRAILGSLERFIGILIEHWSGKLPLWLAPVQCVIATVTGKAEAHARVVYSTLMEAGIRTEIDLRNEKIGYKIRQHMISKIPVILIVGKQELSQGTVDLRYHGKEKREVLSLQEALVRLVSETRI